MIEKEKLVDLRIPFIDALNELDDPKVVLIIADVGFKHATRFRGRLLNVGVTEQSMVILAAALALDGWKPWVYSMRNFVLYRPYEMVRNAVVCHDANVKIVGVSGNGGYGFLGFSHNDRWDGEDAQTAATLGLRTWLPKTPASVRHAVLEEYNRAGGAYLRL